MDRGKDFEVDKEVFERAKAACKFEEQTNYFYMTSEDKCKLFSRAVICGYGLYNCRVYEKDGKYWCSYWTGDSCD